MQKSVDNVITVIFGAFVAGVLGYNLSSSANVSADYNWIDSNKTIINIVFLILFIMTVIYAYRRNK